jgi:hypothetical protein
MKKFLLFAVLVFCIGVQGQTREKVGEDDHGAFVITATLDLVKPEWNKIAKQTVTTYEIISAVDDGVRMYYLRGMTSDMGVKIATSLDLVNGIFYKPVTDDEGPTSTCTCSGCANTGCDPRWFSASKVWICTAGCLACKKTVVATIQHFSSSWQ